MPQNINPYNGQTGMPAMQPIGNGNPSNGNMVYPTNAGPIVYPNGGSNWNQPAPWEQQGWKTFVQEKPMPIIGRWVNSFDEIKPRDVPMDGSICFFPQNDYTCIYAMVWGNDGTIKPFRFIPEVNVVQQPEDQEQTVDPVKNILAEFMSTMNTRLDSLERRIDNLLAPFVVSQQGGKSTAKRANTKESDAT